MSEPVLNVSRASVGGIVCEIKFIGPADAFRGELVTALLRAERAAEQWIEDRYLGRHS